MIKKYLIIFYLIFLSLFPSFAFAEEAITITTYYPSPYGNYGELQLTPKAVAPTCDSIKVGTMYYDSSTTPGQIKICNNIGSGTYQWQAAGGGGYWTANALNIYNTNTGYVGIGTPNPAEKLDVNGNIKLGGTNNKIYISGDPDTAVVIQAYGRQLLWLDGGPMPETVFYVRSNHDLSVVDDQTYTTHFAIRQGKIGIGTPNPTSKLQVVGLPIYASNAAATAGGLTAGAFYRTGGDPDLVCVVH